MPDPEIKAAVVVSGGDPLTPTEIGVVANDAFVVAADSGIDRAAAAGIAIHFAVGDFDSVTSAGLQHAERAGVELIRHRPDKDETDLELAMMKAAETGCGRLTVVGLGGGRFDHHLSSVLLLADERFAAIEVDGYVGSTKFTVVRSNSTLVGNIGDLVSLIPIGGPARGISTEGLEYPLRGETLAPSSPRGVSNVMTSPSASVRLERGVLFAVQPPSANDHA